MAAIALAPTMPTPETVGRVVPVALDGGLHMGRRHELRLMSQPDRLARPMMRRGARFHADKAGVLGLCGAAVA